MELIRQQEISMILVAISQVPKAFFSLPKLSEIRRHSPGKIVQQMLTKKSSVEYF